MSKASSSEHGTTTSYVIGFILSLVFTFIPYHLVVNKILTGNTLLMSILGIAVIQMFIQIFFFLHLGRGPKPFYNIVFFFATAGLIVIVVGASVFIMDNLYRTMSPQEMIIKQAQKENIAQVGDRDTGACAANLQSHIVTIKDGIASPIHIQAKRCDTLTFINQDSATYEIAFGAHPDDVSYGGEDHVVLDDGRPETITLNETGDFALHEHNESTLTIHLSVNPEE